MESAGCSAWPLPDRTMEEERNRNACADAERRACGEIGEIGEVMPIGGHAQVGRDETDRASGDPHERRETVTAERRNGSAGCGHANDRPLWPPGKDSREE